MNYTSPLDMTSLRHVLKCLFTMYDSLGCIQRFKRLNSGMQAPAGVRETSEC